MPENQQHIQAPAYSHYPSAECPRFELETLGKTFITREKYLCGDLLDDRYFLLGSTTYLEFIDLTLPPEQQVPRKLIEFVRFKQIKVLQNERYEGLLTLAGKNNHIRIYDLTSIRLLIKSKMTSFASLFHKRLHGHGRSRSMDSIPDMTTRDQEEEHAIVSRRHHTLNLSQICNNSLPNLPSLSHTRSNSSSTNNENFASPLSSSSSSTNSHNGPTIHHRQHARYESLQHPLAPSTSSEVRDRLENLQVQWSLNYQKLPKTKMAISFTLRSGPTRTYLAILSRQNIFLFELDFGEVNRGPEFVHNRTYWLPQTPKFLQMSMYEDQLLDIIAVFDTEVFMIGVEDARVREITIDSNLCPSNGKMLIPLPSFIHESPSWQTFEQLPWIPILDPELVSDTFTIPPPYSVIINEDPSKMLNPVPIFESENPDLMNSTGPTLFFATFGSKSMIVDVQGRVFSTIVFEWTFPPNHVEFLRSAGSRNESFVVGFGKSMVEVRSFSTGRIVENVVRGAEVQFLGRGLGGKDVIWKCSPRKGSKETSFYRLEGPKI
ncbi:7930_t:CDS:1 [Acaulospora colombiana]|uniref:7930_t:CDS:1 n=1 Tax=Acaulospora colombiana TaxID=27376 RepID=A0ACA9KIJ6_9GLOM|nr:7930_t:CDS:1 [Acaulospora colombiana]